jgi:hypothetical protein
MVDKAYAVAGPSRTARRFGFGVAAAINIALLYAVNGWPGWSAVPFLTDATSQVIPLVNLSLIAGLAVNLAYLAYDAVWFRRLGELATSGIGMVSLVVIWRVFPFAFTDAAVDWPLVVRSVLFVAIAGSALAMVVQALSLVRTSIVDDDPALPLAGGSQPARHRTP